MAYEMPAGYQSRSQPEWNDHQEIAVSGIVYQQAVYDLAVEMAHRHKASSMIDIGCGFAEKLMRTRLQPCGVDIAKNIEVCRSLYPHDQWIAVDLEQEFPMFTLDQPTVVICADVVEHLVCPDVLLHGLSQLVEGCRH